ncbi:AsnC family transcriptional regulator [Vibrio sp. CDRSL-10 TSBA]
MSSPLDAFDQKILELMQRNCRLAADVIAEQVGLSASAVQRRIKKLREEGIIQAEVAIVDPAVTSHNMTFPGRG